MILAVDTTRYRTPTLRGVPMRWPLLAVLIRGPSMAPALRHGDLSLAWRGVRSPPPVRPGDVVLARFHSRPDLLVVKRVTHAADGGWWLVGDNPFGSDDSARYGPAEVVARVIWRYWPPRRFGPLR
jgi:phage repressor protein C with HTH and peptisase S24 domain